MYELIDKKIILASSSLTRQAILQNANIDFSVVSAPIDEESLKQSAISEGVSLPDCATLLAEMKGQKIALAYPKEFIIAGDQILDLGGRCFSKPKTIDDAKNQLLELQGKTHKLHTSVVVFFEGVRIWHHLSSPVITLRALTETEIDTYLEDIGDSALKTPGCYQIEYQGCHIIAQVNGTFFDILGLPLLPLLNFMRSHGLFASKKRTIE